MKKTFVKGLFATLAALFLTTGAHADSYNSCSPCEPECCDPCAWGIDVGADFIYWKICSDENKYAVSESGVQYDYIYKHHGISHDWVPGFRVRAIKKDVACCWDLGVQYTRLSDTKSAHVAGTIYTPVLGNNTWQTASGKRDFTYNNLDVLFGKEVVVSECHRFTPFFGVDMLWLDQSLRSRLTNTEETSEIILNTKWNSNLSAYGLKAGSIYRLSVGCGLEIYGIASGSLLYGDADVKHTFIDYSDSGESSPTTTRLRFKDSRCGCVFGWQVAAGLDYKLDLCDLPIVFNLGYQFIQWYNVPGSNHYVQAFNEPGLSSGRNSAFGLHGLVLGVNAGF